MPPVGWLTVPVDVYVIVRHPARGAMDRSLRIHEVALSEEWAKQVVAERNGEISLGRGGRWSYVRRPVTAKASAPDRGGQST